MLEKLCVEGLKIGFIIGYICEMMDVVLFEVQVKGYWVDYCVILNLLFVGCFVFYMIFENFMKLVVFDLDIVVKVGDIIVDIQEGVYVKVWSVGVVFGSNEMVFIEEEMYVLLVVEFENCIVEVK